MSAISFNTVDYNNVSSGFTRGDVVRMYRESTTFDYPCIVLTCKDLEMFRVDALAGLLGNRSLLENGENYAVYINLDGAVQQIGVIPNTRLKSILGNSVFSVFEKRVHLDSETTVEGDMLFALCVSQSIST